MIHSNTMKNFVLEVCGKNVQWTPALVLVHSTFQGARAFVDRLLTQLNLTWKNCRLKAIPYEKVKSIHEATCRPEDTACPYCHHGLAVIGAKETGAHSWICTNCGWISEEYAEGQI